MFYALPADSSMDTSSSQPFTCSHDDLAGLSTSEDSNEPDIDFDAAIELIFQFGDEVPVMMMPQDQSEAVLILVVLLSRPILFQRSLQ